MQTVFNLFEQNPGREFCEMAVANKAGVIARVHDNSSILKDVVKIDTTIDANDHRKFRDQNWKIYGLKKLELIRRYAADHGMNTHELACKWLMQQPGLGSITGTFLNEKEVQDAINACDKPDPQPRRVAADRRRLRPRLGPRRRRPPVQSQVFSKDATGQVKSAYVAPPVLIA